MTLKICSDPNNFIILLYERNYRMLLLTCSYGYFLVTVYFPHQRVYTYRKFQL